MTCLLWALAIIVILGALPLLSLLVVYLVYGPVIDSSHCRPGGDGQP